MEIPSRHIAQLFSSNVECSCCGLRMNIGKIQSHYQYCFSANYFNQPDYSIGDSTRQPILSSIQKLLNRIKIPYEFSMNSKNNIELIPLDLDDYFIISKNLKKSLS